MRLRSVITVFALAVLLLAGAQAAMAKEQFVYSVKFVCGYNPTNVGIGLDGISQGEPPVKFGNYATEINIVWPELYLSDSVKIFKHIVLLVKEGFPVGREPKVAKPLMYADSIDLKMFEGTMDDCNRIAELLYGSPVPTPLPLLIGYLMLTSTHELDVTAVYTAETCSNWVNSPQKLDCLDSTGRQQGVSVSIDVERIPTRRMIIP